MIRHLQKEERDAKGENPHLSSSPSIRHSRECKRVKGRQRSLKRF